MLISSQTVPQQGRSVDVCVSERDGWCVLLIIVLHVVFLLVPWAIRTSVYWASVVAGNQTEVDWILLTMFLCLIWLSGTSGWVERLLSSGERGWHPMSEDEKRQLCQSHGWRRQWRLWWESQTLSQDPGTPGQLPESHTAITDWDDHSTVSNN